MSYSLSRRSWSWPVSKCSGPAHKRSNCPNVDPDGCFTRYSSVLVAGFLTGLLGVGGGFVIVLALVLLLCIPIGTAIGTSLLITIVNSIAGFLAHASSGSITWTTTLAFAIPAFVASIVAAHFATRITGRALQRTFAVHVLVVAAITIVRTALT